jgi:large subunit ribosomal protein L1
MDKQQIQTALKSLKEASKKRKFSQSVDLIINLKNINTKSSPVSFFVTLPKSKGKKQKVAAFLGSELSDQGKSILDLVLMESDFPEYKADPKKIKKLAEEYDIFIAQSTVMAKMAGTFGKILGMKGKMPNPKMGAVVPPNANLEEVRNKLERTVKLEAKKATNLQVLVGKESMPEDELVENILAVHKATLQNLPNHEQNIKKIQLKLTMSKPVTVE